MTPEASPTLARQGRRRLVQALVGVGALAAVVWTLVRADPFPPRAIVMATGPEGGSFAVLGERYRHILARAGVELRLEATAGGAENLARLRDPASDVVVAFVEGGLASADAVPDVASLGTVEVEPLWAFFQRSSPMPFRQWLVGKRIAAGQEGSATRVLVRRFLEVNGLDEGDVKLPTLSPDQSADALLRREVDGAFILTSWDSPAVRRLLAADGVVLEHFQRADAYVALFPVLAKVVLPAGAGDLARNVPPTDAPLLAAKASLVIREDLHPALQYVLLEAAAEVHGGPDVFHEAGRFPAPEAIDLPLSSQAREFYASGRPFAYQHLPFWLAGLAESLLVVLIPVVAVLYPIGRMLPAAYAFMIERRIYRLYGELKLIEYEMGMSGPTAALEARLESLASRASNLKVPLAFAQRVFILRSHIAAAQLQAQQRRATTAGIGAPSVGGSG